MAEGIVEKLAFGAQGILRENSGRVVFIPRTLPGECIEYEIEQTKKDFAIGHLTAIKVPHPERVHPPCPHFDQCNGCDLQHASLSLQLEIKRQWLQEQLKRIAKVDILVPSLVRLKPWGYRRSVEWSVNQGTIGYRDAKGQFLPIYRCLLVPNDQAALDLANKAIYHLKLKTARIRWISQPSSLPIIAIESAAPVCPDQAQSFWQSHQDQLAGLIIHKKRKAICTLGQQFLQADINGLNINWDCLGFLQNHFEGSLAFYQWLIQHLGMGTKLIDLYCGVGVTSLLAAKSGWHTTGYEISAKAIELATNNAKANRLDALCQFKCQNLSQAIPKLDRFEVLLANPPRAGMHSQLIKSIGQSRLRRVLYLSCHPATLARDIRALHEVGFGVSALQAFDCFGQTTHFETALVLTR